MWWGDGPPEALLAGPGLSLVGGLGHLFLLRIMVWCHHLGGESRKKRENKRKINFIFYVPTHSSFLGAPQGASQLGGSTASSFSSWRSWSSPHGPRTFSLRLFPYNVGLPLPQLVTSPTQTAFSRPQEVVFQGFHQHPRPTYSSCWGWSQDLLVGWFPLDSMLVESRQPQGGCTSWSSDSS